MVAAESTQQVSALGRALLSVLCRREATGYELSRVMSTSTDYFWSARHSQIYAELARLEAAGLVRHTDIAAAGPRQSKRYAVTGDGRRSVLQWLRSEPEAHVDRDPVILRAHALWLLPPDEAAQVLAGIERASRERLALYQSFERALDEEGQGRVPGHPDFGSWATVRAGIEFHQGRLRWCRDVRRRLQQSEG
ncbi:PadR family transcriptional regulator [Flexivirga sp. ID2601S]|uniref:PadR family transcriptional regulator n=1 Tax=Flexivirga aerilata TaxID=1656889 RepID=A0A849AH87_9MICO|nr:PadR family transcriptional regulator [Flexivirga aerilata]NNG39815.1 PadR family transcriptional regulator [Flexivirga aerilata]